MRAAVESNSEITLSAKWQVRDLYRELDHIASFWRERREILGENPRDPDRTSVDVWDLLSLMTQLQRIVEKDPTTQNLTREEITCQWRKIHDVAHDAIREFEKRGGYYRPAMDPATRTKNTSA